MTTGEIIAVTIDVIALLILLGASASFSWKAESDKESLVGFGILIFTIALNLGVIVF